MKRGKGIKLGHERAQIKRFELSIKGKKYTRRIIKPMNFIHIGNRLNINNSKDRKIINAKLYANRLFRLYLFSGEMIMWYIK
jgi:hypothetical protein